MYTGYAPVNLPKQMLPALWVVTYTRERGDGTSETITRAVYARTATAAAGYVARNLASWEHESARLVSVTSR